jgi:hypothetical protein
MSRDIFPYLLSVSCYCQLVMNDFPCVAPKAIGFYAKGNILVSTTRSYTGCSLTVTSATNLLNKQLNPRRAKHSTRYLWFQLVYLLASFIVVDIPLHRAFPIHQLGASKFVIRIGSCAGLSISRRPADVLMLKHGLTRVRVV